MFGSVLWKDIACEYIQAEKGLKDCLLGHIHNNHTLHNLQMGPNKENRLSQISLFSLL
jgi:hypothetical protein